MSKHHGKYVEGCADCEREIKGEVTGLLKQLASEQPETTKTIRRYIKSLENRARNAEDSMREMAENE